MPATATATAPLSHLAFLQALAAESDERTARWRQFSAGLLVLRLFDAWLLNIARGDAPVDAVRVAGVRATVEEIDTTSTVRPVLLGLLESLRAPGRGADVVRGQLLAYARRLQLDASWQLAADVYRTFVETRGAHDVSEEAMDAAFQCGYCFRMAGDADEAAIAYDLGGALATAARHTFGMLRARVCQAKLAMYRGNLPRAAAELDAVIADAEAQECRPALSLALMDRAAVAGQRGQYEDAAVYGYRALALCDDDLSREAVLSDIATALGDAGYRDAAREAHQALADTARDTRVRQLALLNLLELSYADGDELAFGRARRRLAAAPLPAAMRAKYHYAIGEGLRTFGHPAAALDAFRTALEFAEEHGLNELMLAAEAAVAELTRTLASRSSATPVTAPALSIDDVVRGVRALCQRTPVRAL